MSSSSAYRIHCLQALAGDAAKVRALLHKLGVQDSTLLDVGTDAFAEAAAAALSDVRLERFHEAVVEVSGAFHTKLRFDLTPDAISSLADEIIARSKQIEDEVAAVPDGQQTYDNCVAPLDRQERILSPIVSCVDFLAHVHADKATRDASSEADKKLNAYFVESGMREDVYNSLRACEKKAESVSDEQRRLLNFLLRDFRRNGLDLDQETRSQVAEIQKEMSNLSITYAKNLGEENTTLNFSAAELEGMPPEFLAKLPKTDEGLYVVSLKYPEAFPVLKLCKVTQTRRKLEFHFNSRCRKENTEILERLIALRAEQAKLLGFPNHASYILELRMAKKPEVVQSFLNELSKKLSPLVSEEMQALLALKRQECAERNEEFDGRINMWDFRYFLNMREHKEYQVDHEAIKRFFPIQVVTKGMFEIYQELLCLRFQEVEQPQTWHEDVQMFAVHDRRSDELVGYFYLDLHPREGKYGHAAVFGLQAQCEHQLPAAAMVCNFNKPTADTPSLLRHQEVVTFFHEFGHVMHQLCSKVKCARFSGTRVERDFVECPSQMLENWCWEAETLKRMSAHIDDNSPIPDDVLENLVKSKNANAGLLNRRQILFGLFDQTIHSQAQADTEAILSKMQEEIMCIPATPDTNFAASFGHLAGGYDASYYGYMWSEVYSMDMFMTRFKAEGLLNPSVGMDYREMILARGGSRDAMEGLEEFLGRKPTDAAFLESKGLKPNADTSS